jgi:SAM-dependent methyltransferase
MDEQQVERLVKEHGLEAEAARSYLSAADEYNAEEERILGGVFGQVSGPGGELGAGRGEFTRELLDNYLKPGQRLYAVERLDTAAAKLRESITDERLEVINSDSVRLPLPDGAAGLVVSRAALHDFVSDDGDVAAALRDCVRVLAPDGVFLVYDKVSDGFADVERESAEGRMERMNVELAALEGRKCWGLHRSGDYRALLEDLGLGEIMLTLLDTPDFPAYVGMTKKTIEEKRKAYVKRWGNGVNGILDGLYRDFDTLPPRALPMVVAWGRKAAI